MEHITRALDEVVAALKTAIAPETGARRLAGVVQKLSETPWVPPEYVASAHRAEEKSIARDQGIALHDVWRTIHEHEDVVRQTVETLKQPPGPEAAWRKRTHSGDVSESNYFRLHMLDEQRRARLRDELGNAKPSAWLAAYESSIADASEQERATTVRFIESRLDARQWAGVIDATTDEGRAEMTALTSLRAKIAETRDARVPQPVRETVAALERARRAMQHAEEIAKVHPVDPRLEPPRTRREPVEA